MKRLLMFGLAVTVLVLMAGLPALASARIAYSVSKPKLSATAVMGVPVTASGVVRPKATADSRTLVKIVLYQDGGGRWVEKARYRARLTTGAAGSAYSRRLTVLADGSYAVAAFQYRAGRLVAKSRRAAFSVARRVDIDANVNGWVAPALRDTVARANTALDIVFSTPADWASADTEKHYGAAHFIWGDFQKVDEEGLIWHTDGLRPGRYDWMRDAMPKYGTGCLVVAQQVDIDKRSHADTHVLPYLPADVSFGDVSSAGMGCDRSIAFPDPMHRVFERSSADPLEWHSEGVAPGRYDWKCWMDDCHYGTLVADGAAQTADIDTDPDDSVTAVAANTPVDFVFRSGLGTGMVCWRTIFFTTAGDFTKTRAYPDPVTWRTGGLAPGSYEWECWMGPQCHHGTIVVQ